MTEEEQRLLQARQGLASWKRWGPYLSERAWGTVREDYSADGSAWDYFPHDHARSRAYRWNEDGIGGISDDRQFLCFALALWNGQDSILKERLFGLTGPEGNHGEDVKEYYFFLDNTPTHSFMRFLYKYPQRAYPYEELVKVSRTRDRHAPEYELLDTGIFHEDRYWDVFIEYAKADPEDLLIRIRVVNRGPEPAVLHLLPTLWFRNTWAWGDHHPRPSLHRVAVEPGYPPAIEARHSALGPRWLFCEPLDGDPTLLFTENETNLARLFPPNGRNRTPYVKDGINGYVVERHTGAVNPQGLGTRAAAYYRLETGAGESRTVRLRLLALNDPTEPLGASFDSVFALRRDEADRFYETVIPEPLSEDSRQVMRQALAGMLWSKQHYRYNVWKWLHGDPGQPSPPDCRWQGRNRNWLHLDNSAVLSMPDTWEYPWYAAWDLAFHTVPLALVDSDFAKDQILLLLREWFMHPNGQLPAYEWAFDDVNPPVHAWASHRVFQIERRLRGEGDYDFLERVFHKLLLNFTWWVNRKDREGRNVFQGGFLGLDNIGVFDRSAALPTGGYLDQSDGTGWMATYCLNMLGLALELAGRDRTYEDLAAKFLEHFFYIAHAMNNRPAARAELTLDLWDESEGFYYDVLHLPNGGQQYLRMRTIAGLVPLFAVQTLDPNLLERLPYFHSRLDWFLDHRADICAETASVTRTGEGERRLFSVVNEDRLRAILIKVLDETEFLSPYGIRSLSRRHLGQPYRLEVDGATYEVEYEPAESTTGLFGGNSNWRGPVWFPLNYLLIESLQRFDYYYGSGFKIECPTGSGRLLTLGEIATELSRRLTRLFLRGPDGRRPVYGGVEKFQTDPHWRDLILFHEYFHGDTGAGLGASHQTGWTGLVAKLLQQSGE